MIGGCTSLPAGGRYGSGHCYAALIDQHLRDLILVLRDLLILIHLVAGRQQARAGRVHCPLRTCMFDHWSNVDGWIWFVSLLSEAASVA